MIYLFSYNSGIYDNPIKPNYSSMFIGFNGKVYGGYGNRITCIMTTQMNSFDFECIELIEFEIKKYNMFEPVGGATQKNILKHINIKINKIYTILISEL